jgi:hypothetical protein
MGTNYIAPMWRMPENTNKDKLSNYSIEFDGSVKNINLPTTWVDDIGLTSAKKLSFSIWVKPDSTSTRMTVTSSPYNTWNDNFGINYLASSTQLWLEQGASTKFLSTSTTLTANEWSHLLFVFDASESSASTKTKCYINGDLVTNESSTIFTSMTNPGNAFYFGRLYYGAGSSNYSWSGNLGQACFFDYALSTDQITYLYNLNNPMAITGAEPVAYWPLGDNSNPNADAGYPNTSVGADSVFEFNSAGTRINLGLESSLSLGGASKYSTSLWFKKSGNTTNCLWGYNYGDANGSGWYYWLNSGNLRISIGKNGISSGFGTYDISASELPVGKWQHIVVVFNGTLSAGDDRIKVYHNGANAVGTYSNSANFPATLPNGNGASNRNVYLGQLQLGNGSFSYNYDGELSNVQQWSTDLSLSDAETLYNNGQPIMTGTQPEAANLKAWYKLNQSSNWEADSAGDWQIPDATSAFPQSFNFIAANSDAIQFGPSSGLGFDTQISISAWFNQTPGGGNLQQLVAEDKTGSSRNWGIILVGRIPNFQFFDEAGVQVQLVGTALTEGKWHHILCTATGDTSANGVKMYINGQLVAQGTASNENIKNDNIQAKIGTQSATTPTYYFDGKISNVALWSSDQSSEKDNIYNDGIPATSYTNTPQYWYKLDNTETYLKPDASQTQNLYEAWLVENQKYPASVDECLLFASNNAITYDNFNLINEAELTVSFWYLHDNSVNASDKVLGSRDNTAYNFYVNVVRSGAASVSGGLRTNDGAGGFVNNSFSFGNISTPTVGWRLLTLTYNGSVIKAYVNNEEVDSLSATGTIYDLNPYIGGSRNYNQSIRDGNGSANGMRMSNVIYWNKALEPSELTTLYNNGTPLLTKNSIPQNSSMLLWNTLENKTETIGGGLYDKSGNSVSIQGITNPSNIIVDNVPVSAESVLSSGMTEQSLVNNNASVKNGESSSMNTTNIVQSNITRKVPYSSYSTSFLGTTDYFTSTPSIGITNAITISAWVKIPTTNTTITLPQQIICEDNTSGTERNWLLYYRNQGGTNNHFIFVVFHTDGSSTSITSSGITPNNGLWMELQMLMDLSYM